MARAPVIDAFFFAYLVYAFFSGRLINRIIGGPEPTPWKVLQVMLIGTSLVLLTGMRYLSESLENPHVQMRETYS